MEGKKVVQLRAVEELESNTSKADCITALRLLIKDLESQDSDGKEFGLSCGVVAVERNEEDGVHTITGMDFSAGACQSDPRNALFVSELLRSRVSKSVVT